GSEPVLEAQDWPQIRDAGGTRRVGEQTGGEAQRVARGVQNTRREEGTERVGKVARIPVEVAWGETSGGRRSHPQGDRGVDAVAATRRAESVRADQLDEVGAAGRGRRGEVAQHVGEVALERLPGPRWARLEFDVAVAAQRRDVLLD